MSTLKLTGSSSGSTSLQAPASGSDRVITFPDTAGTVALTSTAGKILQVQSYLYTGTENLSLAANTTSGFSSVAVTITPASASNVILVSFTINGEGNAADQSRFSTNIRKEISGGATTTLPAAAGNRAQVIAITGDLTNNATTSPSSFSVVNYPDTAGTTSAITYTVRFMFDWANSSAGGYKLNRLEGSDPDSAGNPRMNSWITAMEVSA